MKRSWLILIELVFAVIILSAFYFYYFLYYHSINSSQNEIFYVNYNSYRDLNQSCNNNNIIYVIYYNNFENYTVCIDGKEGNLSDLKYYEPYFEYLYSGKNYYNPFLIILYK